MELVGEQEGYELELDVADEAESADDDKSAIGRDKMDTGGYEMDTCGYEMDTYGYEMDTCGYEMDIGDLPADESADKSKCSLPACRRDPIICLTNGQKPFPHFGFTYRATSKFIVGA